MTGAATIFMGLTLSCSVMMNLANGSRCRGRPCAVQPSSVVEAWLLEELVQASSWSFAQLITVGAPELTN